MSNSMQSHFNKDDDDDLRVDPKDIKGYITLGKTYNNADDVKVCINDLYGDYKMANYDWRRSDRQTEVIEENRIRMTDIENDFVEFKKDIEDRLTAIEDQIVLVRRDNALEEQFQELQDAWDKYNEVLEKLRTFKALQDSA